MSSVATEETETVRTETVRRIPAAQRRESILSAATTVFAERGYSAATTDQVAKAAGISQPYVVRMFGTKEQLFVEALDRALNKLMETFTAVISDYDAGEFGSTLAALDPHPGEDRTGQLEVLMGRAYADLIGDRGILLFLMQAFISGHEPVIGPRARDGFLTIFAFLREQAGFSELQARDFLAHGMLMNTLMSLRIPDLYEQNPEAADLLRCTVGGKLPMLLEIAKKHPPIG